MTKEELIEKINKLKEERDKLLELANVQDLRQHAFKIFLNSSYGALGSVFYPCFDLDNAEAVTLSGQAVTREMVRYTNEYLNNLIQSENEEFVVAGDTDSISGESKININGITFTIAEAFNLLVENGNQVDKLANGTEVVIAENTNKQYLINSISGTTNIKNISRHRVSKEKWKIDINNNPLFITGDHSVIVYRKNKLIEVKPSEILADDYLVMQ